jgi:HPt (histidine-containing phosphotransfer) domain-containing protein
MVHIMDICCESGAYREDQMYVGFDVTVPQDEVRSLPVFWIRTNPQEATPDAARLRPQGVSLRVLDSVEALANCLDTAPRQGALVLVNRETACGQAMRRLIEDSQGAGMKALAIVVVSDDFAEDFMTTSISYGAVDIVSLGYVMEYLAPLARKHIDADGELLVDLVFNVAQINARIAMERMQSDESFFRWLLREFYDEMPMRRKLLEDAWSCDRAQIKQLCHSLKGLALTLGLERLAQVAASAETSAPLLSASGVEDVNLSMELFSEMQSASFYILRWLALNPPSDTVPL